MNKVSICMTYYNRKELLYNTLESIASKTIPYEIIIVNDGSNFENLEMLLNDRFSDLPIIYVNVNKKKKWWVNPCMAFNIGFKLCTGDTIIIQNAECYHYNDIVKYTMENVHNKYHAFATYSQAKDVNLKTIEFKNTAVSCDGGDGWYNHPIYRPKFYHFCAAISKENLYEVDGFDEEFSNGIAYDDDAFIQCIRMKEIEMINDDNGIAVHQWHYNSQPNPNAGNLVNTNREIYYRKYIQRLS